MKVLKVIFYGKMMKITFTFLCKINNHGSILM